MSNLQHLSDVQVLLLAARFISDVNVESLQVLAAERRDVLTQDTIYRLLLTLYPADEAARSALLALLQSIRSDLDNVSGLDASVDVSSVSRLSPEAAAHEAGQLHLTPYQRGAFTRSDDAHSTFLVSWAHHVESGAGSLQDLLPLFEAFSGHDEHLDSWVQTYLKPLVRLQYEFYPGDESTLDLIQLESFPGAAGVAALLQHAAARSGQADIARDLDQVVAPWISGKPDSASWADVSEWIFSMGVRDFVLSAKALLDWNGPPQYDVGALQKLAQTGFAVVYSNDDSSEEYLASARAIWQRAASMLNLRTMDISSPYPDLGHAPAASEITSASFLNHSLMLEDNELTRVTETSASFLGGVLKTAEMLGSYKLNSPIPLIAKLCLSGLREQQQQELKRLLQQIPRLTSSEPDWRQVRQQLLWLRSWRPDTAGGPPTLAYLSQVPEEFIETELLDAILASGHYQTAMDIYLSSSSPLEVAIVKDHVVAAIYSAYDNASNGNRNRGGIKRASDILSTFKPAFAESSRIIAVEHLLRATHSLSFYHLTLQHGVPFRPVNIRAQKDPLSLIEKVLEQDSRAYVKLDDLVEIGRNLVLSGAGTSGVGEDENDNLRVFKAEHRVTFAAISSALACHDFDTAYSYITSRLLTTQGAPQSNGFVDDTSWRAAYAAGRYRPSPTGALRTQISSLSKRMELLSLALTLAPSSEPLSEILGTWRRCEEELDGLKSTALAEERAFEVRNDGELPGGFGLDDRESDVAETRRAMAKRHLAGGATYEEEAPMGLFEMAKGAASALGKSAFPLHATSGRDMRIQDGPSRQSGDLGQRLDQSQESERVRKRDRVLDTVASGMGWMLGTQPVNRPSQQQ